MKKKGNTTTYQHELEEDLYSTYQRIRREHLTLYGRINGATLYKDIVNSPAKRFYASDEQAYRAVCIFLRGDIYRPIGRASTSREMYLEIYSRFLRLWHRHPSAYKHRLLERIVQQPAPRFYVSPRSAENIICKVRQRKRAERAAALAARQATSQTQQDSSSGHTAAEK